ncbi:FG-GAP-like repeat-containing protein [soil metagenome]
MIIKIPLFIITNSLFLIFSNVLLAQESPEIPPSLYFKKQFIAAESYEAVGVFDINGDGILDIISGAIWYEGPDFLKRHIIGNVDRVNEYWDDFSNIPMDINGDGHMDYVTGSWFSENLRWRENQGGPGKWKEHLIGETGPVECPRPWDVDNDGHLEIVPNNPGHPLKYYKLERDAAGKPLGKFIKIDVAETQGHGLGFGDINGDGRGDFIVSNGWLEAPQNHREGKWILHNDFDIGAASVPILVVDVNGDGKNDLIVGQGHGYGLFWLEQVVDNSGKKRSWIKHPIDPYNSQYHTMEWIDLDGDGNNELVTGKRYRAHNGNDPGANDPLGLYYFKWNGKSFTKQVISYGPLGEGKGAGLYFAVADLRNTGRKDIIVAGKEGLYVFYNEGFR